MRVLCDYWFGSIMSSSTVVMMKIDFIKVMKERKVHWTKISHSALSLDTLLDIFMHHHLNIVVVRVQTKGKKKKIQMYKNVRWKKNVLMTLQFFTFFQDELSY